jgi:hypothetical protein
VWILGTVLGVFLFLLLLLAVPIDLVFSVEKGTEVKKSFRIGWMFGLVSKEIKGKEKPEKKPEKKKKRRGGVKYVFAALKTRGFVPKAATFLKRTLRQIRMHELIVDFDVGFAEPADTGMLFAAVGPATVAARSYPPLDLRIRPDFAQPRLEGYARGDIRVYPIALLAVFMLFALSLSTLRALKNMLAVRRR